MDCVPRCVAGGHLLVCVKVSVMVDIAVMAVLAMPMRGIAVRFEGHEGIDLCCAKQIIVNKQLTVGEGRSREFMADS